MKKMTMAFMATLGLLSLASCKELNQSGSNVNEPTIAFKNMYDYSAISGIQLLSSNSTTMQRKMKANLTEDEKTVLIENLKIVENMLAEGLQKSEYLVSDKEEYETMYTVSAKNFDGSTETYTFYYNETLILDDLDDDDGIDDKDEHETESKLEGIVVYNDQQYVMIGEKEIEENEEELTFKIQMDEQNYIIIEQEKESDEQEFSYTHFKNGKKVLEKEIEFETNKQKIEVEFKEKSETGKNTYRYQFYTKNDLKYVEIKIKKDGVESKALIQIMQDENMEISYLFVE